MPGRHRNPAPTEAPRPPRARRQHRRAAADRRTRRRRRSLTAVAALVVLAVGTPVAYAVVRDRSPQSAQPCGRVVKIAVTASPDIAPAVAEVAQRLDAPQPALDGACLLASVGPVESATMAQALAGAPAGLPQVWIPESTTWVDVARSAPAAASRLPEGERPSLATSPVVIAVPRADAEKRGWVGRELSWATVIQQQGNAVGAPSLELQVPDPTTSAVGMATVAAALGAAPDAKRLGQLTRRFSPAAVEVDGQLPKGMAPFLARAATEQWVWLQASDEEVPPFVAIPATDPMPPNDYPFVRIAAEDSGDSGNAGTAGNSAGGGSREAEAADTAVDVLRRALQAAPARASLHRHGFRASDGAPLPEQVRGTAVGDVALRAVPPLDAARSRALSDAWSRSYRRGRVLSLIDISGSMAADVPGTGRTKLQLALAGAGQALGSFDDETELGVWVFSTDLGGGLDYQQLLPVLPVGAPTPTGATVRNALGMALPRVVPKRGGGTGLFDSTLAAYRLMQQTYDPRRLNTVVVLTDGKDDDDRGIGAARFFAELTRIADAKRPVRILPIAYGADADLVTLRRMAQATGGAVHVSRDPRDIDKVIWTALRAL